MAKVWAAAAAAAAIPSSRLEAAWDSLLFMNDVKGHRSKEQKAPGWK